MQTIGIMMSALKLLYDQAYILAIVFMCNKNGIGSINDKQILNTNRSYKMMLTLDKGIFRSY